MSRPSLASEVRQQLARVGELFGKSRRERLDAVRQGRREHPDPTPVEVPIGYRAPPTLREQMQMYIREELSAQAARSGLGTFDEENDFEPEDPDEIGLTGYESFEFEEDPASDLARAEQAEGPPAADSRAAGDEVAPRGEAPSDEGDELPAEE